jgi:hypothetical protein
MIEVDRIEKDPESGKRVKKKVILSESIEIDIYI